jgi:hypothetical protein
MFYIFRLNKRRTWASRWASLWRSSQLLLLSVLFATVATVIWHQCYKHGLHLPKGAEEMLGVATLVLAAIFAVAIAILLTAIWENLQQLSRCVLTRDQKQFMLMRDERMPFAILLVLAASGLFVLVLLGAAEYPSSSYGVIIMFSSSFVLMLCFAVVGSLQNAMASTWFRTRVPAEWLEQSADGYFQLDVEG